MAVEPRRQTMTPRDPAFSPRERVSCKGTVESMPRLFRR